MIKSKKILKKLTVLLVVVLVTFSLAACKNNSELEEKSKVVKVGIMSSDTDVWDYLKEKLKKEENIDIELVKFSDYNQPNDALANGDIDINSFQHRIFLENYNKEKKENLVAIGDTVIAPLGIYSEKVKDVNDIKANGEIVIPNDVTNQARAINLLKSAGLITIKSDVGDFPTTKDIDKNKKNLSITSVDASQTARALKDVEVSIINNNVAADAGLIPTKDAIFLEKVDENSQPYVNIIVSREEDKDNEIYKKIVKAYQTDDVKKVIEETTNGSSIPAWE
ncbi:MAG: MetQ/NlpA family ABC transporter substrate-binding protein [Peptoniphilaceae bacterium]